MQIKTRGLLLKQRNIGENDRIVTILTAELGIIEATARGVKSARSGISAACQRLSYSEFCLFRGKSGYTINSAEILNSFYNLRYDVVSVALAGYFCELTTYLSPSSENAEDFLKLLLNTLYLLEEGKKSHDFLKAVFELRSLSIAGFMPDLVCCGECASYEKALMYFLPLEGTLICSECMESSQLQNKESVIKIKAYQPVLAAMRHITYALGQKIFSFKLSGDALLQLCYICENYSLLHIDGKFRSLEIYYSLKPVIERGEEDEHD